MSTYTHKDSPRRIERWTGNDLWGHWEHLTRWVDGWFWLAFAWVIGPALGAYLGYWIAR